MRKLIVYPNYSKGGVTTVIRGRASNEPATTFDAIFLYDRGGAGSLDQFPNVNVRVVRPDRVDTYLKFITSQYDYDEISILSLPKVANKLLERDDLAVNYEIHSSDMKIVGGELEQLQVDRLSLLYTPSSQMVDRLTQLVPKRLRPRLQIRENLVDHTTFRPDGDIRVNACWADVSIPLVWVGRFDEGKGYLHVPRILAQLPENYGITVVVSLESDPERFAKFLAECDALGVRSRARVFMDLDPEDIASLYRSAAEHGGAFLSTSLMESFGYAVREALACGLRVVAYSLPVFKSVSNTNLTLVPIGDVHGMSAAIASSTSQNMWNRQLI